MRLAATSGHSTPNAKRRFSVFFTRFFPTSVTSSTPKILFIYGPTHAGKTLLARRLARKTGALALSLDLLKMGLIRSGMLPCTPLEDKRIEQLMWPPRASGFPAARVSDSSDSENAKGRGFVRGLSFGVNAYAQRFEKRCTSTPWRIVRVESVDSITSKSSAKGTTTPPAASSPKTVRVEP